MRVGEEDKVNPGVTRLIASAAISRRGALTRMSKLAVGAIGAASAIGATAQSAAAAYNTYVITNGAVVRRGPYVASNNACNTFNCGKYLSGVEVDGAYACSCNECTSRWFQHVGCYNDCCYIHRGNLNPYNGGVCECP
jgi:hypothetical protein